MKVSLVNARRTGRTILSGEDSIEVEDSNGNIINIHFNDVGAIEVRGMGKRLSTPLHVVPVASNAVIVSVGGVDLRCNIHHPEHGDCYLQRGHEGDHRGHGQHYWTWSTSDEQRT